MDKELVSPLDSKSAMMYVSDNIAKRVIFSEDEVQSTLNGTQTIFHRKAEEPIESQEKQGVWSFSIGRNKWTTTELLTVTQHSDGSFTETITNEPVEVAFLDFCPFGIVGDKIWVGESWWPLGDESKTCYKADKNINKQGPWKSSVTMPQSRSRLALEIVSVKYHRIHSLSKSDILKSGIADGDRNSFSVFWDKNNKFFAWDKNPWIWSVEYRVSEISHVD